MKKTDEPKFSIFKVSLCGNQIKRDYVSNLTYKEVCDLEKFPPGRLTDKIGSFVYGYALTSEIKK